jgi:hypothetical protein
VCEGEETGRFEAAGGTEVTGRMPEAGEGEWPMRRQGRDGLVTGGADEGRGVLEGFDRVSGLAIAAGDEGEAGKGALKVMSVGRILLEIEWARICVGLEVVMVSEGSSVGAVCGVVVSGGGGCILENPTPTLPIEGVA